MLYEDFNAKRRTDGDEVFISRVDGEVARNLNPKLELREYQKEALGRFNFYFDGYQGRQQPAQLLFHMATGSGKTLIMAANILQLYKQGYRNFIFFVNSTNIIEKTKDNFLNELSSKYLFADKIKFGEREVQIQEVDNFEAASRDGISIVFTTIQGLHSRLNHPRENELTYEDFESREVVLISDEAHHINTLTKSKLTKEEQEEKRSWEGTVERILRADAKNILLEFTATIDLASTPIRRKYEDKVIFQYDLKQFRLDKYSKEIEVLQVDLEPLDRALQAVILSQYRRKVAEKNKLRLKPVILFKSNYVNPPRQRKENVVVSSEFKVEFLRAIKELRPKDIEKFRSSQNETMQKAFAYFDRNSITVEHLVEEIKNDFEESKCLSIDSSEDKQEKQVLVNTLEAPDNEIRAVFAVEMLNEGWDVLNLFDIVRLYDTRDAKANKPGPTTMREAQLIGRGARYFPFQLDESQDQYKRKFDEDAENELRVLEQLFYHSAENPRYIQELKIALTDIGIYPERTISFQFGVKPAFKKSEFWKSGVIFTNKQILNPRANVQSLQDAEITKRHRYVLKTGNTRQDTVLSEKEERQQPETTREVKIYRLSDFSQNVVRNALDRLELYRFDRLKGYFPYIDSVSEFMSSLKYLGEVEIEVVGPRDVINQLSQEQKLYIALDILKKIAKEARENTAEFVGTKVFEPQIVKQVFRDKVIKLDADSERAKGSENILLADKNWYAHNELYGTSEEKAFIGFVEEIMSKLNKHYSDIALFRNERFFKLFDFSEGRRFEPDFVMFLKKKGTKGVSVFQILIEPKGNQFKDSSGGFENSKEGWKQDFLGEMENKADIALELENQDFRLIGMPFYNESTRQIFEETFEGKLL